MNYINVLSVFDGMSCGQIALKKAGVKYDKYYASEIDKYAIKTTQKNYPDTIQLGDIQKIDEEILDSLGEIDLLIGGSPCQGFSFAGKMLNFEDVRSKLFFEYVRIKEYIKPKYFLLENVPMKKEHEKVITDFLQVEPLKIDASLVSAHGRTRLYWTNIPFTNDIKKKDITLNDIIDFSVDKGFPEQKFSDSSSCKERMIKATRNGDEKAYSMTATMHKGMAANGITNVFYEIGRDKLLDTETLRSVLSNKKLNNKKYTWRKITPTECEKIQTVPIGYTEGVSNTQRYKMLGNGWTVDVIAHILSGLNSK